MNKSIEWNKKLLRTNIQYLHAAMQALHISIDKLLTNTYCKNGEMYFW